MDNSIKKTNIRRNIAIVGFLIVGYFIVMGLQPKQSSLEKSMMKAMNKINQSCPFMVDSITRVDNVAFLSNNVFEFNYTITNSDKFIIDTIFLQNKGKQRQISNIKSDTRYKFAQDNHITYAFCYYDINGYLWTTVTITPDEYK